MEARGSFTLNAEQQQRLLALRAAWEEGEDEERLERLRLREEDAEAVRAFDTLLSETDFAAGNDLTYAQMARLLALARALAPNPNLDARLLRRPNEPEAMNHDLRELLFGKGSSANRLRGFLSRRHAGGQTAMQLLCAREPETWPLVTQAGLRALQLSPEQTRQGALTARERFDLPLEVVGIETYSNRPVHVGIPDNDPILRLLGDAVVYEAARDVLEASDYLTVHRLLTRGMAGRMGRGRHVSLAYPPTETTPSDYIRVRTIEPQAPLLAREPERPGYDSGGLITSLITSQEANAPAPPPADITGYTQNQLLALLEREIAAQGFTYAPLVLRDYYICLQSKPFVLLSGLSGTGKTRLTSLFAQALTGRSETQYRLLPVRPDWADSSAIVGYVNLLAQDRQGRGTFVSTPFLDFLQFAARNENGQRAFFLCLDEMNLARVEHYFAEVLSAMETSGREMLLSDNRAVRLPANLFLTGTLNLDEATHSLSLKVLDRANTLTFGEVCLREEMTPQSDVAAKPAMAAKKTGKQSAPPTAEAEAREPGEEVPYAVRQALFLQARVADVGAARLKLRQVSPAGADYAVQVVNVLADVNGLLEPYGLHFAYRVRDEALRYCANSFDVDGTGLLAFDAPHNPARNLQIALDLQLLQKVLPRLTGTAELLDAPIGELLRYGEKQGFEQTVRRLKRMRARLERDGFVSFDAL